MSRITVELKKQFEELQARQVSSTPLEVLEDRRRAASEAAGKITEGETPCAREVEVVSMIWEALLEYETAKNIRATAQQEDEKISVAKSEMKKLPFQEKVIKMEKIKQL